ncbi:MAG: GNAT family N-acetyltransferase [Opitutaceae bacterium]|jgi:RimJ/RimL family protein N-acetyltransferase
MCPIKTPRLSLREISTADDEFIFALMNEPAYIQYIGDRGIRTLENARAYITDKFAASYAKFGFGLYLVELKERPVSIGICGLVKRDSLEHPDIGFALLREHCSRGFAFEAASAVLDYGFGALELKTVLGVTLADNKSSIRLLEKLGLKFQKMIRLPRMDRDNMLFSTEGGIA